ncbi:MAG: hypothetical protein BRC29_02025 [Nanohaloarchaea archaeon SW_7_43_1]|nr:MAG: hypothetical protein BRC29_02025 [Nanohaloarchaea archaeon SW_7_43_1]
MKYYLDSNIFIYSVTEEDPGRRARDLIRKIEEGKINGATSVLTLDEIIWIVQKEINRETAIKTGRKLLMMENLEILSTDAETGTKSLQIMEENKTDPRDSMHIATARNHGIYTMITEDSDMADTEIETINTEQILERLDK